MNSLGTIFKLSRNPDPTKDPEVILAIKRMHRKIGRQQTQATPLTRSKLEELLNKCPDSMRGLRNQILLLLGYETMRRRAELCAFRFEDLTDLAGRGAALRLVKSKTDQEGVTKLIPVSPRLKEKIALWQNYAKIDGVILRSVDRHGNVGPKLSAGAIGPIINSMTNANIASERAVRYSGHSFRVGAALDLLDQNETLDRIMLRGGWKTESSVMRYLQLMSL